MRAAWAAVILLLAAAGCAGEPGADPLVRLETSPAGAHTRVTLVPASHIKLNARLKPALELADGSVLRFDTPRLTADSAYFAEPPAALLPGRHRRVRGTLRASVCENDAPVCRALVMDL
jgi:hypothetical protein